ncbi:MAG: hypothetical protein II840_11795 [Kiritimatiellae bacterium]|nr:hypothetical protein [Kiritimatiellia bacterium]
MKSPALSAVNAQCVSVASAAVAPHAKFEDVKRGVKRAAEKFSNASQGTVVSRGPLLFAYPIPAERTEDRRRARDYRACAIRCDDAATWRVPRCLEGDFHRDRMAWRDGVCGDSVRGQES